MKKKDLKNALGKIRPREELIQSTLARIDAQKEREAARKPLFSPAFNRGMRLAGAFCAIALVVALGFALRKGDNDPVVAEKQVSLADLRTVETEIGGAEIVSFSLADEAPNGVIEVKGIAPIVKSHVNENEDGTKVFSATIQFQATELCKQSDHLTVDLANVGRELDLEFVFPSEEVANEFFAISGGEFYLTLTPGDNGDWILLGFAPVED